MADKRKEMFEEKERFAEKKMLKNREIETLTEEQHELLADLCRIRHELHTNAKSEFNGESDYIEKLHELSDKLENENLSALDIIDYEGLTLADDYYNILDEEERNEWEEKAMEQDNGECGYNLWVNSIYDEFSGELEKINSKIEDYLLVIDKEHGTSYCPTGIARMKL